jgi:hypothetical protein
LVRTHASYRALLASQNFADPRTWARNQQSLLQAQFQQDRFDPTNPVPVHGHLVAADPHRSLQVDFRSLDDRLAQSAASSPLHVVLIDGPAGIGKTIFIDQIALARPTSISTLDRPLLLVVRSRGRVLTFIADLIAYSLQTLRVQVMYDQLPVLVRRGLICLAIDGFDELGDPGGYDLAWAQVNALESFPIMLGHSLRRRSSWRIRLD